MVDNLPVKSIALKKNLYSNEKDKLDILKIITPAVLIITFFPLMFCLLSCNDTQTKKASNLPAKIFFSKNWKACIDVPANLKIKIIRSANGNLEGYYSPGNEILVSYSNDDGITWTNPDIIYSSGNICNPVILSNRFCGVEILDNRKNSGQLYFTGLIDGKWSTPAPIRNTNKGKSAGAVFNLDKEGNLYCVWTDTRSGNSDIYFSASSDNGNSWAENICISDDLTGQEQARAKIIITENNVICAVWDDNRDGSTLFDIYCSVSTDKGKSWSRNIKINDDTTRSWQIAPSITSDNSGKIYLAWMDSREKNKKGERESSIYFSVSSDDGKTWSANCRLSNNDTGIESYPQLTILKDGMLNCVFFGTGDNLLFDIYNSFSNDKGKTWSKPAMINDDLERAYHQQGNFIDTDSISGFLYYFLDWREGRPSVYFSRSVKNPDKARSLRQAAKPEGIQNSKNEITYYTTDTLFEPVYKKSAESQWRKISGTWIHKDNYLVGYGKQEANIFAGDNSWKDYVFRGNFFLNNIDHRAAYIYFRSDFSIDGKARYYRLTNFFRQGVTLEYFDGENLIPVIFSPYSLAHSRMYKFRLVVKNHSLNYFINDTLHIGIENISLAGRGGVGVGTIFSPTYFSDLIVLRIE